jgi:hypothetical protein
MSRPTIRRVVRGLQTVRRERGVTYWCKAARKTLERNLGAIGFMSPLAQLRDHGQSFWLDSLSRRMLEDGSLAERIRSQGLSGVTSNPAILREAMGDSSLYEPRIRAALETMEGPTRCTSPWRSPTFGMPAISCCRCTRRQRGRGRLREPRGISAPRLRPVAPSARRGRFGTRSPGRIC